MTLSSNYGAAPTYVKIASTTLTATTSTITFSNIPQGYTDLRVVIAGNQYTSASYGDHNMRYNSDSGSNYSNYGMYSNTTQGTTPIANYSIANQTSIGLGAMVDFTAGSNTWVSHSKVDIMSYSNTAAYKSCLVANSMIQSGDYSRLTETVGTWRSTAAITSISFHAITDPPFNVGVTVNIYGIKAALTPKASGGDIIVQDGTYWYHAFRTTGAFVPRQSLTCDYLVVAGGGGAGSGWATPGGGGGAGGYLTSTGLSVSSATTVTIGAGGAGGAATADSRGTKGSDSVFSVTATGGGYGAENQISGGPGGSGGGGAGGVVTTGGAASPAGQGNAGGGGNVGSNQGSGGGGGSGAAGGAGTTTAGGAGGAGLNTLSSWFSATRTGVNGYIAGGGGGSVYNGGTVGAGGAGGGGAGSYKAASNSGIANTGSGGGATGNDATFVRFAAGNGGSGLVIVRYPI